MWLFRTNANRAADVPLWHAGNRKMDVILQDWHRNLRTRAGIKSNYLGPNSVSLVIRAFHSFPAISCHISTLLKYYKQHPHRIWAFWRLISNSSAKWGRDLAANLAYDPLLRDSTIRMGAVLLANNFLSFGYSRATYKIKSNFQITSSCKAWSKFRQQAWYFPFIQSSRKVRLCIQFPFLATTSTHPFHRQDQ